MNIDISLRTAALSLLTVGLLAFTSCHRDTLEDKAEKMAAEYTERYCPTPYESMQRTDSITFDRATRTFNYYYTLNGLADNAEVIDTMKPTLRAALVKDVKDGVTNKVFKEAGYSFRHTFRSEKTKKVLFEALLTEKDYN